MPPAEDGATYAGDCSCPGEFPTSDEFRSDHRGCPHCQKSDSPSSSYYAFETNSDKIRRVISASVKGFTIGAGLKGGLALFSLLARLSRRRSSKKAGSLSSSEDIKLAITETLRYGFFLGTFAGTFTSVDELIATLGGHRRCAYILKQDSLSSSYKSFLNKQGAKDLAILQGVKELVCGMPLSSLGEIENYYRSLGVNVKLDPNMKVPCSMVHGNQSCEMHVMSFLIQAYKRALPVYLPVYLVPALIVHRQDLLKR
ncbi:hypothetical protein Cgig2_025927 [Carnegiea gigantea]|uniref:Uncharacterized protein n=1 Tax=Carnegiea gigantea TaxID=171969 RepID=A0A9Q1JZH3_9CARY|nr:hypothetical protein Cgig2_025927 [Carnegiea gigantea]